MNYSKALDKLVQGLELIDVWKTTNTRAIYTHYTPHGAARIDRLYVSPSLRNRKMCVETVMAAFKDHLAVCLRISLEAPLLRRGRGQWKMNINLLEEANFRDQLQQEWSRWKQQRKKYLNSVTWWESYVRRKIRYMFMTKGKERAREATTMENFYYSCIYDILQEPTQPREKSAILHQLKAKIIRLHNKRIQTITVDAGDPTLYQGETPSLLHLIQGRKRREARMDIEIRDENGQLQTTTRGILNTFVGYMKRKYGPIQVDDECVDQMVKVGHLRVAERWGDILDMPIMAEELQTVVHRVMGNKAPGRDGICVEFFKKNWSTIMDMLLVYNQMYSTGNIREQQKHAIVVCIPKTTAPKTPADYRPITLLNTDYKFLARIVASRLRPILAELLHPSQQGGMQGGGTFDAVATVRDAIAYAEKTQTPMLVLSLDFTEAFDRISHIYLFKLLSGYGLSTKFIGFIKNMYDQAYSSIHINGQTMGPIPIQCGFRQGCPLSMMLFALSLNPLLWLLDQTLTGNRIGTAKRKAVVAYTDDKTLFLTDSKDIPALADTLRRYQDAT